VLWLAGRRLDSTSTNRTIWPADGVGGPILILILTDFEFDSESGHEQRRVKTVVLLLVSTRHLITCIFHLLEHPYITFPELSSANLIC